MSPTENALAIPRGLETTGRERGGRKLSVIIEGWLKGPCGDKMFSVLTVVVGTQAYTGSKIVWTKHTHIQTQVQVKLEKSKYDCWIVSVKVPGSTVKL